MACSNRGCRLAAWTLVLFAAPGAALAAGEAPERPERPNVVFVFIDDMGYGDLSCFGARDVRTEHIDRLAEQGIRLTQFYVNSPICSPSRVAATTGQYPARHLINSYLNTRRRNRERGMADYLDPSAPCVARAFQQAGYATAHFGKWHMGGGRDVDDAPLPQAYGFDESLVSFEGLGDRVLPPGRLSDASEKLGRGQILHAPKHQLTEIYVDRAIDFIERNRRRPFYLHLWLNDVHDPHLPREDVLARYARFKDNPYVQRFYAVLDEMDRQLGRLFAAVDSLGLGERTLIVLTSDNGPTAWPRYYREGYEPPGSTGGLRGRKWSLYEGGIRAPFVARWPGVLPAGAVNEQTVMAAIDLFPTLCALAGVEPPEADFDGEDLSPALLGETPQRRKPLCWEYGRDSTYLKPGRERDQSPNLAIRDGRWKLLMNDNGERLELYDLSQDASETNNVAGEHREVAERLAARLLAWRRSLPRLEDRAEPARDEAAQAPISCRLPTRWTKDVERGRAWREHPRPQMVRPQWLNLNGLWDYAVEGEGRQWTAGRLENARDDPLLKLDRTEPQAWEGKIRVPYCIESALSGVQRIVRPDQILWYRTVFSTPPQWRGRRIWLRFEAVDWHAVVWVNGRRVGEHRGGYDRFSFDVTEAVAGRAANQLVLAVWDPSNIGDQPVGKQSLPERRRGFRYTPTTGIWQTVWLEATPPTWIDDLRITPDVDRDRLTVEASLGGEAEGCVVEAEALENGRRAAAGRAAAGQPVQLALDRPRLWTPDTPFLYGLRVRLRRGEEQLDEVSGYFAMRKVSLGKDEHGAPRILLNHRVLPFQFGPLDQGYWPDGILTPPSDEAAAFDIQYLKRIGCNMARVHVKSHPDRWYYHCDRLGLLVWQDMPCTRKFESKITPQSAAQFELELRRMINRLRNHPSIILWVLFNEGWGQYDTERLAKAVMDFDPTRLVTAASGWTDVRGVGHVHDVHDYTFHPTIPVWGLEPERAVVLGECGGFNVLVPGHIWHVDQRLEPQVDPVRERNRESYADSRQWLGRYGPWLEGWSSLIGRHGLSAAVYTQISDVEHELNGWLTYDRQLSKIDPLVLRRLHERLYRPPPEPAAVLLPCSRETPQTWRVLAARRAPDGWMAPEFDDNGWERRPGPFVAAAAAGAPQQGLQLFLRREIQLSAPPERPAIEAYANCDVEVYVNGQLVQAFATRGTRGATGVSILPLPDQTAAALKAGTNVIAVRASRPDGAPLVDLGLLDFAPPAEPETR